MKRLIVLLLMSWIAPAPALTPQQLAKVFAAAPVDARLDRSHIVVDETGRSRSLADLAPDQPLVLLFADYTCSSLCSTALGLSAAALSGSGLAAGRDYRYAVVGLDPNDSRADARAMRLRELGGVPALRDAAQFVSADAATLAALTAALGYHYVYDAAHDQFAHPAVVYIVAADGRVQRMLDALQLDAATLRLALLDARQSTGGGAARPTLGDSIHQLCYAYDPVSGRYSARILSWLSGLALLTLALLAALLRNWQHRARAGAAQ